MAAILSRDKCSAAPAASRLSVPRRIADLDGSRLRLSRQVRRTGVNGLPRAAGRPRQFDTEFPFHLIMSPSVRLDLRPGRTVPVLSRRRLEPLGRSSGNCYSSPGRRVSFVLLDLLSKNRGLPRTRLCRYSHESLTEPLQRVVPENLAAISIQTNELAARGCQDPIAVENHINKAQSFQRSSPDLSAGLNIQREDGAPDSDDNGFHRTGLMFDALFLTAVTTVPSSLH